MVAAPYAMIPAPSPMSAAAPGSKLRLAMAHAPYGMSAAPDTMSVTPIRTLRLAMAPAMSAMVPVPRAMSADRDMMSLAPDHGERYPGQHVTAANDPLPEQDHQYPEHEHDARYHGVLAGAGDGQ